MYYRFVLLILCYIEIIAISISDYRYMVKIEPLQSHTWRTFKTVLTWVMIMCSGSLLNPEMSYIITSYIAVPIFALVWIALEYEGPHVYYLNCKGPDYENRINFVKDHIRNKDITLEENKINSVFGCKVIFRSADKKRIKQEANLLLLELQQNQSMISVERRTVYWEVFEEFMLPTIFYCWLTYKILHMSL